MGGTKDGAVFVRRIFDYAKESYGAKPEYLWSAHPDYAVLRDGGTGKWFAVLMTVDKRRLGIDGDGSATIMNVKCEPLLVDILKRRSGYLPAYHMNKSKWISVVLDENADMEAALRLLDESRAAVCKKQPSRS